MKNGQVTIVKCARPDDSWLPTGLSSCLGIILKVLAHSVHHFRQVLIGSRIWDLASWKINLEKLWRLTLTSFLPSWVPSPLILNEPISTFFLGSTWERKDKTLELFNTFSTWYIIPSISSTKDLNFRKWVETGKSKSISQSLEKLIQRQKVTCIQGNWESLNQRGMSSWLSSFSPLCQCQIAGGLEEQILTAFHLYYCSQSSVKPTWKLNSNYENLQKAGID